MGPVDEEVDGRRSSPCLLCLRGARVPDLQQSWMGRGRASGLSPSEEGAVNDYLEILLSEYYEYCDRTDDDPPLSFKQWLPGRGPEPVRDGE